MGGYGVTCRQSRRLSEPDVVVVVPHVQDGDRGIVHVLPLVPDEREEGQPDLALIAEAVVEVAPPVVVPPVVVPLEPPVLEPPVVAPLEPPVVAPAVIEVAVPALDDLGPVVLGEAGVLVLDEAALVGERRRARGHVERYGKCTGRQQGDVLRS